MRFKTKTTWERALYMSPVTLLVMADMAIYCNENHLPFLITETFTTEAEDRRVNRQHACHREGRAFDVSIRGWHVNDMKKFEEFFEKKWGHLGALSTLSGNKNLVELHKGTALHFHVQVAKTYAVKANFQEALYDN